MSISNESLPIIAGIITNTARSMTTVMQYIYTVSDSDFYNINIKSIFKYLTKNELRNFPAIAHNITINNRIKSFLTLNLLRLLYRFNYFISTFL